MIRVRRRHTQRPVEIRQFVVPRLDLGLLDAPLDLSNGVQPRDTFAVGHAEAALQSLHLSSDRVQQAGAFPQAARRSAEVPPLPKDSRTQASMRFGGSGVVGDDHRLL